jgi:hypothetical protein
VDIARSEAVEADLDRLIERRSRKGEVDPDEREALWQTSVRRYNARRREEMRAAWAFYHEGQAERHRATLQALIEHHESEAARLMDVRPKGAWGEQSTAPRQRLPGQGGNAPAYEIP